MTGNAIPFYLKDWKPTSAAVSVCSDQVTDRAAASHRDTADLMPLWHDVVAMLAANDGGRRYRRPLFAASRPTMAALSGSRQVPAVSQPGEPAPRSQQKPFTCLLLLMCP